MQRAGLTPSLRGVVGARTLIRARLARGGIRVSDVNAPSLGYQPIRAPRTRRGPSGFPFLDRHIGGLRDQKRYLFLAEQGVDRTIAAIQFLLAGLESGETCLLLSAEDPEGLFLQAEQLELPISRYLASDQLILLSYDRRFAELVASPTAQDYLLADLRRKTGNRVIQRIAFLELPWTLRQSARVAEALDTLEQFFVQEHRGVVAHFRGESSGSRGESLSDLRRQAFGVFSFDPPEGGTGGHTCFRLQKEPALTGGAVRCFVRVERQVGFAEVQAPRGAIPVIFVGDDRRLLADLQSSLGGSFSVRATTPGSLPSELLGHDQNPLHPILILQVEESFQEVIGLIGQFRRRGSIAPLFVFARSAGRVSDRVLLLRQGVDDILLTSTPLQEIRERIRRHAVRLGLVPPVPAQVLRLEAGKDLPRSGEEGTVPWGIFRQNLEATIAAMSDHGGHFTLMGFQVGPDQQENVPTSLILSRIARDLTRQLREEDPCAVSPDGLLVCRLYGVGHHDVEAVVRRLLERLIDNELLRSVRPSITCSTAMYPHHGTTAEELYKQLLRPERQFPFPVYAAAGMPEGGETRS